MSCIFVATPTKSTVTYMYKLPQIIQYQEHLMRRQLVEQFANVTQRLGQQLTLKRARSKYIDLKFL